MKKLDRLLIKAFIPPFLASFGLVMFVFTMQTMWKFIDDILGKGAGVAMIIEFIFYLSMGLVPFSLPAAILLSSVMVMGSTAEHYELTSMKSAGISLWRIMWPLIGIGILIGTFSFVCNNNIVPVANLKFKTRLYNFKTKKLALSLEEGVFNDDFRNFSIRIDKKYESGKLEKIMLYDHSAENRNRTKIIMADDGKMETEADGRYLIMHLNNGKQYQELEEEKGRKKTDPRKYPYLRLTFGELEKYMDMKEFDMKDVNEDVFKDQERMMSVRQLWWQLDTMDIKMQERAKNVNKTILNALHFIKTSDSTSFYLPLAEAGDRELSQLYNLNKNNKSNKGIQGPKPLNPNRKEPNIPSQLKRPGPPKPKTKPSKKEKKSPIEDEDKMKIISWKLNGNPKNIEDVFSAKHKKQMLTRTLSNVKSIESRINDYNLKLKNMDLKKDRYIYEIHMKFALAVACLVFLFIGAPLGAIVRKGGFGLPVLFGTILFVAFIALVTVFQKISEAGTISPELAAWTPVFIYAIPCVLLTRGAIRDAKAMNLDLMVNTISNFLLGNKKDKK